MPACLQEVMRIEGDDAGLIGLCNVREDAVNHSNEHSVLMRMAGIFNDGHYVGSFLRNVEQISTRAVRKFDRVYEPFWSYDVRDVGNRCSRGCPEVQHLNGN